MTLAGKNLLGNSLSGPGQIHLTNGPAWGQGLVCPQLAGQAMCRSGAHTGFPDLGQSCQAPSSRVHIGHWSSSLAWTDVGPFPWVRLQMLGSRRVHPCTAIHILTTGREQQGAVFQLGSGLPGPGLPGLPGLSVGREVTNRAIRWELAGPRLCPCEAPATQGLQPGDIDCSLSSSG